MNSNHIAKLTAITTTLVLTFSIMACKEKKHLVGPDEGAVAAKRPASGDQGGVAALKPSSANEDANARSSTDKLMAARRPFLVARGTISSVADGRLLLVEKSDGNKVETTFEIDGATEMPRNLKPGVIAIVSYRVEGARKIATEVRVDPVTMALPRTAKP